MRFVVIPQPRGRWTWELRDATGSTVCESAGSYISRERAIAVIQDMRRIAPSANVIDEEQPLPTSHEPRQPVGDGT